MLANRRRQLPFVPAFERKVEPVYPPETAYAIVMPISLLTLISAEHGSCFIFGLFGETRYTLMQTLSAHLLTKVYLVQCTNLSVGALMPLCCTGNPSSARRARGRDCAIESMVCVA